MNLRMGGTRRMFLWVFVVVTLVSGPFITRRKAERKHLEIVNVPAKQLMLISSRERTAKQLKSWPLFFFGLGFYSHHALYKCCSLPYALTPLTLFSPASLHYLLRLSLDS
jgi:hypothetical protein